MAVTVLLFFRASVCFLFPTSDAKFFSCVRCAISRVDEVPHDGGEPSVLMGKQRICAITPNRLGYFRVRTQCFRVR
jgi:hypothetical protein